ncbi:MAG: HNH endonuclease [Bdellovibrionales bacterium]|nr:HNH endonuclease [Bdellovibrionales bacterium]
MNQDVRKLSNEILIALFDKRVELESLNEAEMVDFIREVMHRRLWLEYGATSMFDFMTRAHYHYAPSVAQRKIDAARLLQMFPQVKELILSGEVNLTQLGMLAAGLRQKPMPPKMQKEILESIRGQTIKNTQVILNERLEIEVKTRPKIRVQRDGSVRAEITFTKEQWEVIERAKDILSHSVPNGELTEVLSYCARFTVAKKDSSLPSMEVKPRHCQGVSRTARRYVFQRDKTCCYVHADGRRCDSRYQLQVDHIVSLWRGGRNDVENLQLLCGLHNRYKYEQEIAESAAVS